MAVDIATQARPQVQGPPAPTARPLSADFAELMARADGSAGPVPAPGPKPLSANFAEMMAAAGVDGPPAPRPAGYDMDAGARSMRAIREGPRGHGGGIDFHFFGRDGLTIGDLIDVINPLQHIPVVSALYRWATGDEISPAAELAGGFLYGGPIGLAASAADVVLTAATGEDLGAGAVAMVLGPSPAQTDGFNLADAPERHWGVKEPAPSLAAAPAVPESAPQVAGVAPGAPVAAPPAAADAGPVTLTEDQLAALLAKARGGRVLKPLPPPGPPAKLPPARPAPAASAPPTAATTAPGAASAPAVGRGAPTAAAADAAPSIAERMSSAWDKYEALLRARAAAADAASGAVGSRFRVDA